MQIVKKIGLLLGCIVLSLSVLAQAGSTAFAFMSLPPSARLNALGGTNVSLSEGEVAMAMCNPALLSDSTDKILQMSYSFYGAGQHFGSVCYGHNFGPSSVEPAQEGKPNRLAVGLHYLNYGKFVYADEYGNLPGGTFSAQDIVFDVVYSRQLGRMFSVGVALKPVYSVYDIYTAFALGADVGGHFALPEKGLQVGLSLQNIGWQLKGFYSDEGGDSHLEMLPLNLQLGLSYKLPHAPIRFSFTAHNLQRWDLSYQTANIGTKRGSDRVTYSSTTNVPWYDMLFRHTVWAVDIVPKSNKFWITLSYNHRRRMELNLKDLSANVEQKSLAGFAAGVGINIKGVKVGVAASQYTKANYTFQLSLSLDINQLMK